MSGLVAEDKPSFREALSFWWKLGWISFGGTAAHISIMHEELVERKQWISNGVFLHALSHCMILPGPEAQQLAIYIGTRLHGTRGGLIAGTLFVLPSTFVLLALSIIYVQFGKLPSMVATFAGLKPAVLALVILALYRVSARALRRPLQWAIAALAFAAMFVFNVPLPAIMVAVIILGAGLGLLYPALLTSPGEATAGEDDGAPRNSLPKQNRAALFGRPLKLTAIALALWLAPLPYFYFVAGDFSFWKTLTLFFTKTAFVTIGGSYTVIPYVAQVAVGKLHWLSQLQMSDGFALAETTPGPLIIVVAFVGFMAAYNHFQHSLWMGTLGLLLTTFYTFLPCFLFVFAGAPLVEHTHGKPALKAILALITAVVVGAMLDLLCFLGRGVFFPAGTLTFGAFDFLALGWVVVSLVLLTRFGMNVAYVILLSIAFGVLRRQFGAI